MKSMQNWILLAGAVLILLSACSAPQTKAQQANQPVANAPAAPAATEAKTYSDIDHVKNVVNARQPQLQTIYRKQSYVKPMQGELAIKLYITEDGRVQNAEIDLEMGNLTPEFLQSVREELLTWRFMIKDKIIYSFRIQFRKS